MRKYDRVTIRLTPELQSTLNGLAKAHNKSAAALIRDALSFYEVASSGGTDIDRRRQFSHEFLFLVVDKYLAQTDQQTYDHLISEATKRVETLYARA